MKRSTITAECRDRRGRYRRSRKGRCGAALVETAVTLPVLLLVLFGIMTFGSLFFARHTMLHAAREAARVMAIADATAADAEAVALDRLSQLNGDFNIIITEPDPFNPDDLDVVVEISVPVTQVTVPDPFSLVGPDREIRVRATMRKEELMQ